nr:DUF421 domain-containing protein [Falsibacillus pallidus]
MEVIWKAIVMILTGTILLRIAGRKSISQMNVAQTVIIFAVGSIIIQPFIYHDVFRTIVAASVFVLILIIMEFLQIKFNFFERFLTGTSIILIEDGELQVNNLKKLRFSVDELEMHLRQKGVSSIHDVKMATLESNGMIGYELKDYAKPLTVGDFEKMLPMLVLKHTEQPPGPIFQEVEQKKSNHDNQEKLN